MNYLSSYKSFKFLSKNQMSDFAHVLKEIEKCSTVADKMWSIEPDYDPDSHCFNGVIVGGAETEIWGSIFPFTMYIDENNLTEPPKISFSSGLYHPLIEPVFGSFCYPPDSFELSSRMPMTEFLDDLVSLFLLKYPISHPINPEAAQTFSSSPAKFWSILRQKALNNIRAA